MHVSPHRAVQDRGHTDQDPQGESRPWTVDSRIETLQSIVCNPNIYGHTDRELQGTECVTEYAVLRQLSHSICDSMCLREGGVEGREHTFSLTLCVFVYVCV